MFFVYYVHTCTNNKYMCLCVCVMSIHCLCVCIYIYIHLSLYMYVFVCVSTHTDGSFSSVSWLKVRSDRWTDRQYDREIDWIDR